VTIASTDMVRPPDPAEIRRAPFLSNEGRGESCKSCCRDLNPGPLDPHVSTPKRYAECPLSRSVLSVRAKVKRGKSLRHNSEPSPFGFRRSAPKSHRVAVGPGVVETLGLDLVR
jgi:hypothetical protein